MAHHEDLNAMDIFLICYDVQKNQSKGTNYHKIMEFFSAGKVIISNNISTYKEQPELVQMIGDREDNKRLPELFHQVIGNLASYNSSDAQRVRSTFAKRNTYASQVERIEKIIAGL